MARAFIIALILALLSVSPASAEVYALNFISGSAVIDENASEVIPAGLYDMIYVLRNDDGNVTGYAAGRITDNRLVYAILSPDGNVMTDFIYSGVWQAGEGFIGLENGIYRYISSSGVYNSYSFSSLIYIGSGRLLAINGNIYDDIGDEIIVLWPDGISFRTGVSTLNGLGEYSEGLLPVYDDVAQLYGYMDTGGEWAIPPRFIYAGAFSSGLAIVATDDGYGIIDTDGAMRLSAGSRLILRSDNIIASIRGDTLRLYDNALNNTCTMPLHGASVAVAEDHIIISENDSEAVYDRNGTLLFTLPPGASVAQSAGNTFIVRSGLMHEEAAMLYSRDGIPISESYRSLHTLDSSRLAYGKVCDDGVVRYGLLDIEGNEITEAVYISIAPVCEGLYCADTENGAVIIDGKGSILNTFTVSEDGSQK